MVKSMRASMFAFFLFLNSLYHLLGVSKINHCLLFDYFKLMDEIVILSWTY